MQKLNEKAPYGTINGIYEELPAARYTQDGQFFDAAKNLIAPPKQERKKDKKDEKDAKGKEGDGEVKPDAAGTLDALPTNSEGLVGQ